LFGFFLDLAAQHIGQLPVSRIFESLAQSLNSVGLFPRSRILTAAAALAAVTRVL